MIAQLIIGLLWIALGLSLLGLFGSLIGTCIALRDRDRIEPPTKGDET